MSNIPDNWVVIFLNSDDPHYRILAGWSGGFATGDSWKMNSGIVKVEEHESGFNFIGSSGSSYIGRRHNYCLRMNNSYVWTRLSDMHGDKVSIMPEDTDWLKHDWIITEMETS